jgi:hypothetical protein
MWLVGSKDGHHKYIMCLKDIKTHVQILSIFFDFVVNIINKESLALIINKIKY